MPERNRTPGGTAATARFRRRPRQSLNRIIAPCTNRSTHSAASRSARQGSPRGGSRPTAGRTAQRHHHLRRRPRIRRPLLQRLPDHRHAECGPGRTRRRPVHERPHRSIDQHAGALRPAHGQYPWRKPGTGIAAGDAGMIISPEQYTLADLFKSAGYVTGAVGKWHLGLGETARQQWNGEIAPGLRDIGFDYSSSWPPRATASRAFTSRTSGS